MIEHDQQLIQSHDRMLITLETQLKQVATDIADIKTMLRGVNSEHRDDNNGIYSTIRSHEAWTKKELSDMTVEIAVLKTKMMLIGAGSGAIVSAVIAILSILFKA